MKIAQTIYHIAFYNKRSTMEKMFVLGSHKKLRQITKFKTNKFKLKFD